MAGNKAKRKSAPRHTRGGERIDDRSNRSGRPISSEAPRRNTSSTRSSSGRKTPTNRRR